MTTVAQMKEWLNDLPDEAILTIVTDTFYGRLSNAAEPEHEPRPQMDAFRRKPPKEAVYVIRGTYE